MDADSQNTGSTAGGGSRSCADPRKRGSRRPSISLMHRLPYAPLA